MDAMISLSNQKSLCKKVVLTMLNIHSTSTHKGPHSDHSAIELFISDEYKLTIKKINTTHRVKNRLCPIQFLKSVDLKSFNTHFQDLNLLTSKIVVIYSQLDYGIKALHVYSLLTGLRSSKAFLSKSKYRCCYIYHIPFYSVNKDFRSNFECTNFRVIFFSRFQ